MGQAGLRTQSWRQWKALVFELAGLPLWSCGVPSSLGKELRFLGLEPHRPGLESELCHLLVMGF